MTTVGRGKEKTREKKQERRNRGRWDNMEKSTNTKKAILYDKDIREPLFEFLEELYDKMRIIEEKQMGKSRADIVMILTECIVGIEIKSDADTYARLARQVKDYNMYFDYNYVVIGSRHGKHIKEHVPPWWGIISVELVDQKIDFYVMRQAQMNPHRDMNRKISILWRPELAHIQEINHMPRYPQKSKAFVAQKILNTVPEKILNRQISDELFERDYTLIENTIKEYKRDRRGKGSRGRKRKSF